MSYTYINFEPKRDKITDNMKYFRVAKDYAHPNPKDGKKKCTSEQIKKYNDVMKRRDETFKRLQVGNIIDMGNRYLVMKDIKDEISWNWNEKDYIYKIEPINCEKHSERYSKNDEEVRVSSFQVVKRIETITELLDDVSETFYYGDIFNEIFYSFRYKKSREDGLKFFEYFTNKYPDKKIYLSDILYQELHSYKKDSKYRIDDTDAKEYAEELYNKGFIELNKFYEDYNIVEELIKSGWFKLCIKYIKLMQESKVNVSIDLDKDVLQVIREHTDNPDVNEIVKLLNIKDSGLVLVVKQYIDDGYDDRLIEKKAFKDINEARTYVIKMYDVSIESAMKRIDNWRVIENGENDDIFFELEGGE